MKKDKNKRIRIGWTIFITLFTLLYVVTIIHYSSPDRSPKSMIYINSGWTVSYHENEENVNHWSNYSFDTLDRGEVFTMTRAFTQEECISSAVLCVYSMHSAVTVKVGNEVIYTFGHELYEKNKLLGYGWHYMVLDDDYAGQEIEISYIASENKAFSSLPTPKLYSGTSITQELLSGSRITLSICLFLLVFGLLGMGYSIVIGIHTDEFIKTFFISLFAVTAGLWAMSNNDLLALFVSDLNIKTYFEYLCFYFMSIPFVCYFGNIVQNDKTAPIWMTMYSYVTVFGNMLFFAIVIIFNAAGIAHFPTFVSFQHILILHTAVFVIVQTRERQHRTNDVNMVLAIGFALAIIVAFAEMAKYNIGKYITGFDNNTYNNSLAYSALIIVLSMIADFLFRITKRIKSQATEEALLQMAYTDELTGLANRRKCDETLENIGDSGINYALISFDLNNLKETNDSLGHQAGDMMLRNFSETLQASFPKNSVLGRIGGDEFVAFIPEATEKDVTGYINELERQMRILNSSSESGIKMSTAYGVAFSTEDPDFAMVTRIADQRMYENKRKYKQQKNRE